MKWYNIDYCYYDVLSKILKRAQTRPTVDDSALAEIFPNDCLSFYFVPRKRCPAIFGHVGTKENVGYIKKELPGSNENASNPELEEYIRVNIRKNIGFGVCHYRWYPLNPEEILFIKLLERCE